MTRFQIIWELLSVFLCTLAVDESREVFIPHVFQQVTFSLVFKVQSCHLLHVCVFQLLCHFYLEEILKKLIKYRICHLFTSMASWNVIYS